MFENFEQEKEEPAHKQIGLIVILSFVLLPIGFMLAFHFLPGMQDDPSQMSHTIGIDDAQLRRVHELCTNLPRPEKFEFISSYQNGGLGSSTVIYRYNSTRGAAEIMPAFLVWFDENGWSRITNTSTYEKGKQTVYISVLNNGGTTQYEIYCTEK